MVITTVISGRVNAIQVPVGFTTTLSGEMYPFCFAKNTCSEFYLVGSICLNEVNMAIARLASTSKCFFVQHL